MTLLNIKKIIEHFFFKSPFSQLTQFEISYKFFLKWSKITKKKFKKVIVVPKITNTFDLSSQKSKKNLFLFFSDFSHGITLLCPLTLYNINCNLCVTNAAFTLRKVVSGQRIMKQQCLCKIHETWRITVLPVPICLSNKSRKVKMHWQLLQKLINFDSDALFMIKVFSRHWALILSFLKTFSFLTYLAATLYLGIEEAGLSPSGVWPVEMDVEILY